MAPQDYDYIVGALKPLLDSRIRGLLMSSEEAWVRRSSHQAVVCTELEKPLDQQNHEPWLKMLAAYDRIVAREVSMHAREGFVVRPVRNGYLLVFNQPKDAAEWSRRLQFAVCRHNQEMSESGGRDLPIPIHNVALGYGPISRVLRAHGYDYVGGVIDACIELAARLSKGHFVMSRTFADQYESHVGTREVPASTKEFEDPTLGTLQLLTWPWSDPVVDVRRPGASDSGDSAELPNGKTNA